jgi:hypothetical protein
MMRGKSIVVSLAFALSAGGLVLPSAGLAEVTVIPVTGTEVTTELTGTVEVVNLERRMLTIRTPDGRFQVIHVPEEVKRLNEIKIGNRLTITETEAVLVDLVKGPEAAAVGATQESFVERESGARPAGVMVDTLTLYGRVESIDKTKETVTVRGSEEAVELKVNDRALLDEVSVGDGVVATFVRSVRGKVEFR